MVASTGAVQQQAVKGNGLGLEGVELDLSELAFLDFAPAIDARLGLLSFAAVQAAQKFVGAVAGSGLTVRGTREGFDRVAAKKLAPVVIEEIAGGEDVAPGDLFDHYWRKLLRSYAVEALTRPTYRPVASRDNANDFLRRLNGRETQETEPGVYRWREIKEGQLAQIELDALQPKPMTLHRLLLHRTS